MKRTMIKMCRIVGLAMFGSMTTFAQAQDDISAAPEPEDAPLRQGAYIAPLFSYVHTGSSRTDDGFGGTGVVGYRNDWYAIETGGLYDRYSTPDGHAQQSGFVLSGLIFPLGAAPNLYATASVGALEFHNYLPDDDNDRFSLTTYAGGLGYLFPLRWRRYEFAIRAEALYRYGDRDAKPGSSRAAGVPTAFKDALVNIGLQLPLRLLAPPPAPVVEPVKVVPAAVPADSDGDGVSDSGDQCPNTAAGTKVDDVGCPLPPPCALPAPGQKVDLSGCAAGDSVVLHGVNFEYDSARLSINAKTILDGVADALSATPSIQFEIDGHTDSRGSDSYNQKLSEERAQSVLSYLQNRGIATDRMSAQGYGETQPIADNDSDEGRELNRRVELTIKSAAGASSATTAATAPTEAPTEVSPGSLDETASAPAAPATDGGDALVPDTGAENPLPQ